MQTASRITSRIFAVLFALGFVVTLILAVLLFNAERRIFDPNTYKIALVEQNLYERMPGLLSDQIIQSTQGNSNYELLNALKPQDIEAVIRLVLPPEDLQRLTEEALDQLFSFLNGEISDPQISTRLLKDRLRSDGVDAILQVLHAQPPCTDAQIAAMVAGSLNTQGNAWTCSPPDSLSGIITPLLNGMLSDQIDAIPDSLPLKLAPRGGNAADGVRMLRLLLRLTPLVPIGFLFLVTLLVVQTLRDWLRWWGFPLAIGGALTFIVGLALGPLMVVLFDRALLPHMAPSVSAGLVQAMTQLVTSIAGMLARPILIEAAVLCLLGLALVFLSRFVIADGKPSG